MEKSADAMVAMRLRAVRRAKGLSQRELARRTGVGSGTISQIEAQAMQPSVALLKRILDGVPMDLGAFFSFELPGADKAVFRRDEHVDIGAAGVRYLLIAAGRAGRALQMLHETYEPGRDSGRRALAHEGEECGVVIRGVLELELDGALHALEAGDAYYFASATPHRFRNPGPGTLEIVSACTPPSF